MELYLIRHGESETNAAGIHSSWQQVSLTEKGVEEARRVGERLLREIPFDKIYASDLRRAMQTAETALPGAGYETTPLLREINSGAISGKTAEQCEAEFGPQYYVNKTVHNYTPYGGENAPEVLARVTQFLNLVRDSGLERVAAFTHAGILRAALSVVTGMPLSRLGVCCPNCAVAVFTYGEDCWRLRQWNP